MLLATVAVSCVLTRCATQARDGVFLNNLRGHNSIVNTVSTNEDNVLFSGGDNGTITFWDYETGHPFQVYIHACSHCTCCSYSWY
jgi:WD40 repeat protein